MKDLFLRFLILINLLSIGSLVKAQRDSRVSPNQFEVSLCNGGVINQVESFSGFEKPQTSNPNYS